MDASADDISTFDLLTRISQHGSDWPALAPGWSPNGVAEATRREIDAGLLQNLSTLSDAGRTYLLEAKARQRLQ